MGPDGKIWISFENGMMASPPICERGNGHNKYRAVAYKDTCSIVPADFESDQYTQNLDGEAAAHCLDHFHNLYEDFTVHCQYPDLRLGTYSLYLSFPQKLGSVNRTIPYPAEIPQCEDTQNTQRVIMRVLDVGLLSERQLGAAVLTAPAVMPRGWMDPMDEDVQYLATKLEEADAFGLCQKRISPNIHALFFVGATDINGKPEDPAHVYRTSPHFLTDPVQMPVPADVLIGVLQSAKIGGLTEEQFNVLENIIAFSVNQGLDKEDLFSIAEALSRTNLEGDEFLYSLLTVASLRIARALNYESSATGRGGISEDFNDFTQSIEAAIVNGAIGVHGKIAEDLQGTEATAAAYAYYLADKNEISFEPFKSMQLDGYGFSAIVHECYHGYEDMLKLEQLHYENEFENHVRSEKLGAMFSGLPEDAIYLGLAAYVEGRLRNAQDVWQTVTAIECAADNIDCYMSVDRNLGPVYYGLTDLWEAVTAAEASGYSFNTDLNRRLFREIHKLEEFRSARFTGIGLGIYNADNYDRIDYVLDEFKENDGI